MFFIFLLLNSPGNSTSNPHPRVLSAVFTSVQLRSGEGCFLNKLSAKEWQSEAHYFFLLTSPVIHHETVFPPENLLW